VLCTDKPPIPATEGMDVLKGQAVKTGRHSRCDLTFPDGTITRLWQDTIWSTVPGMGPTVGAPIIAGNPEGESPFYSPL